MDVNLLSFLVSLKPRRSKTTFLYENKCRENSQGLQLVKVVMQTLRLLGLIVLTYGRLSYAVFACTSNSCRNGGNCTVKGSDSYICQCTERFYGDICEKECIDAFGMEDGAISDGQITASSQWNADQAGHQGRLHNQAPGGWVAATTNVNQWLQIDLGSQYTKVTRLATQGRNGVPHWVTKYKLQYSNDGVNFQYYREPREAADKEFTGNTDQDTVVYHDLSQPITARYVRFLPVAWYQWISMRVELYGCKECNYPLGMKNHAISDGHISASSEFDDNHAAIQGRLGFQETNTKAGTWSARTSDANQWLQIDLGSLYTKVTSVITQGRHKFDQWVTKYKLQYSDDGVSFQYYRRQGQNVDKEFSGNIDQSSWAVRDLNPPITARYIRFRPTAWNNHISMRVELVGCIAVSIPNPKALYPLNSWYGTREISNAQPQGIPVGVSVVPGPDGLDTSSYQFSGHANSYIEFPNNGGLDVQHSITLLCWFYPENTDAPLFHYVSPNNDWGIYMWILWGKLIVRFKRRDYSSTPLLVTATELALNQWHYVGSSYDHTTGIASLWLNGERVVQKNIGAGIALSTQDNVRMGEVAGDGRYLSARITAMQVYDAALTAGQINKMNDAGQDKDECQDLTHNCDLNAQCNNTYGSFNCSCVQGYSGDGLNCTDVDECRDQTHNCNVNARCNNTFGSFNCTCLQGYSGDGVNCSDVDECQRQAHDCDVNAQCNNTFGSFNCTCIQGYSGDGVNCYDVDECQDRTHNCDVNAQCNNTFGSFYCTCLQGYSGNGVNCSDLDECQGQTHNCDVNAQCNNTFGSFNCTCLQGYSGDGVNCSDVDECQNDQTHNCDVNAHCNNTYGSFDCTCLQGYSGDGVNCYDVDECQDRTHNCDVNAQCNNTNGSFYCTCLRGYSGNGEDCLDIDECRDQRHKCDVNARCNNTNGSFYCTCLLGYVGDGVSCSDSTTSVGPNDNGSQITIQRIIVVAVSVLIVMLIFSFAVLFFLRRRQQARRHAERSRAAEEAAQYNFVLDVIPTPPPSSLYQSIDPSTTEPHGIYEELNFGTLNDGQDYENQAADRVDLEYLEPVDIANLPTENTASTVYENLDDGNVYLNECMEPLY